MEAIAVLADNVRDLPLPIEHEERHVCRGGLGKGGRGRGQGLGGTR